MISTFTDCVNKYGSKYKINKLVSEGKLFRLEKGIYADQKYIPEYQIISTKFPKAIFTLNSAFYYHGLTDVVPEKYYLVTSRGASKISDKRVVQIFENSDLIDAGAERFEYENVAILMYNKERLLIELLRKKNSLPFDYYKEIVCNYRKIIESLDIPMIQDFAFGLPKSGMIMNALQLEVF